MKLTSIVGFFLILFMLLFTFSLYSRIPPTSGTSDLNQLDANNLYVRKNPLTSQSINGFDLNIITSLASIPNLTLRNNSGTGSETFLRTVDSTGTVVCEMGRAFGVYGTYLCPALVGVAFGVDLSNFFLVQGAGAPSSINDPNGFNVSNDITVGGNAQFNNDINVSRDANVFNLKVSRDANFLQNARIKNSLYVDVNIFADTYEKDRAPEWALDLCYVNNGKRDLVVYGSILSNVKKDADLAYVDIYTDTGCTTLVQSIGIQYYSDTLSTNTGLSVYDAFSFLVHDGNSFMLTSNTTGTSTLSLNTIRSYFP